MAPLPWRANPGTWSATLASRSMRPCSSSLCITIPVTAFAAEKRLIGVPTVRGTACAGWKRRPGVTPLAWPIARSSTTVPRWRMQIWMPGCIPVR